jgi:hypothetical protein
MGNELKKRSHAETQRRRGGKMKRGGLEQEAREETGEGMKAEGRRLLVAP